MKYKIYNQKGKTLSRKVDLDESIFNAKINEHLMSLSAQVYLANQRQSNAHTKTRAERRGGGAKPWAQKGTGRARHGSIRSPIWKKGGVTFGPRNVRNYKKKLTKKMKRASIVSCFSILASNDALILVDQMNIKEGRLTKQMVKIIDALPLEGKVLIIHDGKQEKVYLSSRNLPKVDCKSINEVNAYMLMNYDQAIVLENVLDTISKFWGSEIKKKKISKKSEKKSMKKDKPEDDIKSLDLGTRIENALEDAGIKSQQELRSIIKNKEDIDGIGVKSKEKIVEELGVDLEEKKEEIKKSPESKKNTKISELNLGTRIENALKKAGIETVEKLKKELDDAKDIVGIGEKSLEKIKKSLSK